MSEFYSRGPDAGMAAMPDMLAGSLRKRLATAADYPKWGSECERLGWDWAGNADERYRAFSELHPTRAPLLRVGVKDNIHCEEFPTRLGTRGYRQYPRHSAAALARVPAHNVTGKTRLTELTLGLDAGCRTPLIPDGWPGASSTGSAVAVSANICDLAIGTDSLGSVRIPAIACGVVSMRLTYDATLLDGVLPVAPSLDAVGWFARSLDDLRLGLRRFGPPAQPARPQHRPARIAVVSEVLGDDGCDPRILRGYEAFVRRAEGRGVEMVPVALGDVWKARLAAWELCAREAFEALGPYTDVLEPLGEDVWKVLRLGESVSPEAADRLRSLLPSLREDVDARLGALDADSFVMPVYPFALPAPAEIRTWPMLFPDVHDPDAEALAGYAPIASLLGWPALTVPTDDTAQDGLRQTGVQLVGRPHSEHLLIDLAEKLRE